MGSAKYLVDENSEKQGVLLCMKDYLDMIGRLEELKDALELDEEIGTAEGFREYRGIRRELKQEGRL